MLMGQLSKAHLAGENEPILSGHVAFVGGFEFADKTREKLGLRRLIRRSILSDQIAAASTQDFADGCRSEIDDGSLGGTFLQQVEGLFRAQQQAGIKRIDEERSGFLETADHEVTGQADGL